MIETGSAPNLAAPGAPPYVSAMKALSVSFVAVLLAAAGPVAAQTRPSHSAPRPAAAPHAVAGGPRRIGKFEDWQAAEHQEAGQTVCYAFTRPSGSAPALPGRGDVVLTVTERPDGRDAVALAAGFAYPREAEVHMIADGATLPFYTSNHSAFAKDGKAAVTAFGHARQTTAHSTGPRQGAVTDTFSLRGFAAAYAAINKACPPR